MSMSQAEAIMSDKILKESLALELTCPICLEFFSEPVSIPCGHIYCFVCLQGMGEVLDQHSCPECQAKFRTDDLVKSFKMCSIIETFKSTTVKVYSTAKPSDVDHVSIRSADRSGTEESNTHFNQDVAAAVVGMGGSSGCQGFQTGSKSTEKPFSSNQEQYTGKVEMEESKLRLASQITKLNLKLDMAESALRKEKQRELELTTVNNKLRENALPLLKQIEDSSQKYSAQVLELIEEELGPGEALIGRKVCQASELTKQLREALFRMENLLTADDGAEVSNQLPTLQQHIVELLAVPLGRNEDHSETKPDPRRTCSKLEIMDAELRKMFGDIYRCLRNTLNPSEVTFDPETAHPNLILSEDLKTVTFSATKQSYPSSPQRFTSFFQVLSTQSFSEGDHCWEVELDGSPWIIGVCYSGKLARSGMPSALESSRSSWCLMWFNNLLTAFEQSHNVPLMKTTVSCRLEIRLSFKTQRLSFYNISPISGRTHVYTFKANMIGPVHLAYRMMSGHPKARVTICL